MKQKLKNILPYILAVIMLIGGIIIATKGLNFDLKYQKNVSIKVNLKKEFDKKDIKEITNEIFKGQKVNIQAIEVYEDSVKITTTEITEEQKADLISKLNEKYEIDLNAEDVVVVENSNIRGREIIKPYIIPFTIITIVILAYQMIRFNKLNAIVILIQSVCSIVVPQLLLLSIIAICRIPVMEIITAVIIAVYILSIGLATSHFEKELSIKKEELKKD